MAQQRNRDHPRGGASFDHEHRDSERSGHGERPRSSRQAGSGAGGDDGRGASMDHGGGIARGSQGSTQTRRHSSAYGEGGYGSQDTAGTWSQRSYAAHAGRDGVAEHGEDVSETSRGQVDDDDNRSNRVRRQSGRDADNPPAEVPLQSRGTSAAGRSRKQ